MKDILSYRNFIASKIATAESHGFTPSSLPSRLFEHQRAATIGNKVAANARLIERLRRRVDLTESDLARIEAYIEANPIAVSDGGATPANQGDLPEKAGTE